VWNKTLKYDPITSLLKSNNKAINYYTKTDLIGDSTEKINLLSTLEVKYILSKQEKNGSWKPAKNTGYPPDNKKLVETFRNLRTLVRKYRITRDITQIQLASEYMYTWQTKEGDFRGFIGDQYATYYTGEILAILTLAGYRDDQRTINGLEWLLSKRQEDGGWTIPMLTHKLDRKTSYRAVTEPWKVYEPIREMPFSHNWTDMVLRAFSVHPKYCKRKEVLNAAELLKSRFFKPDVYGSYKAASHWVTFTFWWPNIVTSLDSLSRLGYGLDDKEIKLAVEWLQDNQQENGLWRLSYKKGSKRKDSRKEKEREEWLTLEICRILKRIVS
jgi:squalene cyclase